MNKKILIVEDVTSIIEELSTILGFENYIVLEASNGRIGLEMARKELPDLIISDILMPEVDGYTFREELKKDPLTAEIPFIFFSAMATKDDLKKGFDLGAAEFVVKPFNPEELLSKINNLFFK